MQQKPLADPHRAGAGASRESAMRPRSGSRSRRPCHCGGATVGGLEELDDASAPREVRRSLVPLDLKDYAASDPARRGAQRRYQRLDVLVGNAGILGPVSPLATWSRRPGTT